MVTFWQLTAAIFSFVSCSIFFRLITLCSICFKLNTQMTFKFTLFKHTRGSGNVKVVLLIVTTNSPVLLGADFLLQLSLFALQF